MPTEKENQQQVPDPGRSYERADPNDEAGLGKMDAPKGPPAKHPDAMQQAVTNRQDPTRQINAEDVDPRPKPEDPGHSMFDEEPDGWDLAPTDIKDPRQKRHPKTEGKGGTP